MLVTIWLLCGVAAAVVASNRGANGCLWFALGIVLGPIGFALAFTTGQPCPHCASRISSQAAICPRCGRPLAELKPVGPAATPPRFCNRCGAPHGRDSRFCPGCGQKLSSPELDPGR